MTTDPKPLSLIHGALLEMLLRIEERRDRAERGRRYWQGAPS